MNTYGHLHTVASWERDEGSIGPLGATWLPTEQAWNFCVVLPACDGRNVAVVRREGLRRAGISAPARSAPEQDRPDLALLRAATVGAAARYYAYRVEGPGDPGRDTGSTRRRSCSIPSPSRCFFRRISRAPPPCSRARNDGRAPLGVLPRNEPPFDWGKCAAAAAYARHGRLRVARQGFHGARATPA